MKQDRFLTGILIGIGVLVAVALAVFFTRQDALTYVSDDAPEGVVHNYVLALINKNYERAYGYLADVEYKPTYEEFRRPFLNGYANPGNAAVDIGVSEIDGDQASVEVTQIYNPGDLFSSGYRDVQRAILVRQSGAWKISFMPAYNFWDYSWYSEPPKP
ncbi:hypothetical protein FBQ81_15020 [Chloroflexi bacterium CFX6]|nr:hypothetical protein [Chloroflexi bacterium CFX6]